MKKTRLKLRVIAGKIKNKSIECPPGIIRPMTAITKEALFNIIGDCSDLSMLDLFTGSGSIAIEAFSRGIKDADLVEFDAGKKTTIMKNLKNIGFESAKLFIQDAIRYCKNCTKKYDFIMLDPPFNWDKKKELMEIISQNTLLKDDGFLVMHIYKKESMDEEIGNLICYDKRNYGINTLLFYKYKLTS